jgi:hypothetical protein
MVVRVLHGGLDEECVMSIPRVAAAAGVLLVLAAVPGGPASAASARPLSPATVAARSLARPGWTVQHTPKPAKAYASVFTSVSCASATACTAVGYAFKTSKNQVPVAFAEAWNGTRWSFQPTPKPAGSGFSVFYGVSCASATACTAVGDSSGDPLAERWNGTRWSVQSLPYPVGAYDGNLYGVSCTSPTACTAVGEYYVANKLHYTLAYAWNGAGWSIQASPNPKRAGGENNVNSGSRLMSVSCLSATACTAAGVWVNNAQDEFPLAERWNGTSWSIQPTVDRESVTVLDGVSCAAATACMAAGLTENHQFITKTLAEAWNGTRWSVLRTPNAAELSNVLDSVSCTSATACTAAGYDGSNTQPVGGKTLAEVWNGTRWSIQATRDPGAGKGYLNDFYGVSCTSPTACTAVGEHAFGDFVVPLAERYSG